MKPVVIVGVVLIVIGVLGLAYGGVTYTKSRNTTNLGPIDVTVTDKETLPIHPAIGAVVLLGGIVVTVAGLKKR